MSTAAFAEALLHQVDRALASVPAAELEHALATVDAFLAAPRAETFLTATRALRLARARRASDTLTSLHDDRIFRRGLEAMRALPGLDPEQAAALGDLPVDARTGKRLLALAQLIEAHLELSGRAAAAFREIRRKLAATPAPTRPRPY